MSRADLNVIQVGPIMTNCYILKNRETDQILIVDPGDEPEAVVRAVNRIGGEVCGILLTHGHHDHILGLPGVLEAFKVPVYACLAEKHFLEDPDINMTGYHSGESLSITPDVMLTDGQEFELAGFRIRLLHTPGHTPGSCCYYLEDEKLLFSGDTLFRGSIGRTDFPQGSMEDILKSLHRLLSGLPDDTQVFPGHNSQTTIAWEKRYNPFV